MDYMILACYMMVQNQCTVVYTYFRCFGIPPVDVLFCFSLINFKQHYTYLPECTCIRIFLNPLKDFDNNTYIMWVLSWVNYICLKPFNGPLYIGSQLAFVYNFLVHRPILLNNLNRILLYEYHLGACSSIVAWGTMLQAGRSWVRFPMPSNSSVELIFPATLIGLGSIQPLTEISTRNLAGGKRWPACNADNFPPICEPIM
jgi:hypothetical protein